MQKCAIMNVSNSSFFRKMKGSLLSSRRVFSVEARLLIKEANERIYENPKTKDYHVCLKQAKEAFEREEFKEALPNIQQCLKLLEKTPDSVNNLDRARIYEFAGKVHKKSYCIQDSIRLFQKSLELLTNVSGEDNMFSPSIIYELADSYSLNCMPKESIYYYRLFLKKVSEKASNDKKLKILVFSRIAINFCFIHGPEHSIRLFKQVIRLYKEYLQKNRILYYKILREIAMIYFHSYRKEESAAKFYEMCLNFLQNENLRKQISKQNVYDLLIDYYQTIQRPDRSVYLVKRAIKYLKKLKNDSCLSIARKYKDLSYIYRDQNDSKRHFYYLSKHLIILEKIKGKKDSEFLVGVLEYLDILRGRCYNITALERLKNIPKEFKNVLRDNKSMSIYYKLVKGTIYSCLSMTKKASKTLKKAKKMIIELFGGNHPRYVEYLLAMGTNLYYRGDYNRALAVSRQGFILSKRINTYLSVHSIEFLKLKTAIHMNKGNATKCLKYYDELFHVCKLLGLENTYQVKKAYLDKAYVHYKQGDKQSFFHFIRTSLDLKVTDKMIKTQYYSHLYHYIADYCWSSKNFKATKRLSIRQLKIYLSSGEYNSFEMIPILYIIARCEIGLKNYWKLNRLYTLCKKLSQESVEAGEAEKIHKYTPLILLIKAYFYYHYLKNYDDCLSMLRTVVYLQRQFSQKYDLQMYMVYEMIGNVYFKIKKHDQCLPFLKLTLKIMKQTWRDMHTISNIYQNIGIVYNIRKMYDKAMKYYKKSLRKYKKIDNIDLIKRTYHLMGNSYIFQMKPNAALKYLNKAFMNSTISKNMSLRDTCILNSIGVAYIFSVNKVLLEKATRIFEICIKIAIKNNFDSKYTRKFLTNLVVVKDAIERAKTYWNENRIAADQPEYYSFITPCPPYVDDMNN